MDKQTADLGMKFVYQTSDLNKKIRLAGIRFEHENLASIHQI